MKKAKADFPKARHFFEQKKSEGQAQLDYAYSQISSGRTQLDAAKAELAQQSADGQAQLDSAESKLNDAQSEYDSGVAKLAEEKKNGEKKLSDAQTEYDDGVKKPMKNSKRQRIKSKMQRKKLILLQNQSGMSLTEATTRVTQHFLQMQTDSGLLQRYFPYSSCS